MLDTLIRGGKVFDGTGKPLRKLDVAITAGRIVEIVPHHPDRAIEIIDAENRVVCPGFIDLHSHGDLIFSLPPQDQLDLVRGRILQGITTEIVGNCGLSPLLAKGDFAPVVQGVNTWMTPSGQGRCWETVGDYLEELSTSSVALNVGTLVGHGPARISAMGLRPGEPDAMERREILHAVESGLDDGAFGLSTGLIYPPGMYSSTDELTELARVVAARGRLFTCHVRGSSETLLQAAAELVTIGRSSGAHVHHSHHEAVGRRHWHKVETTLEMEAKARKSDLDITTDMFPYVAAATMMLAIYPPWALEGGPKGLVSRLKDPATRNRIRRFIEETVPRWPPWEAGGWPHNLVGAVGWDQIQVASVCRPEHRRHEGRTLAELARIERKDAFEAISDLMIAEDGQVGQLIFGVSGDSNQEPALRQILAHPLSAICTDANDFGKGRPHPAAAGSFARVLGRYVRGEGLLDLETALTKMTSYPASILGLQDRGRIEKGCAADLLVFDPAAIEDHATFESPRLPASGIDRVMINGRTVAENGRLTGVMAGQVLRKA